MSQTQKFPVMIRLTAPVRKRLRIEAAISNRKQSEVIAALIMQHIPERDTIAILTENLPEAK